MIEGSVSPRGVGIHVVLYGPLEDSVASKSPGYGETFRSPGTKRLLANVASCGWECDWDKKIIMLINLFRHLDHDKWIIIEAEIDTHDLCWRYSRGIHETKDSNPSLIVICSQLGLTT